jgi:hypothetical protein
MTRNAAIMFQCRVHGRTQLVSWNQTRGEVSLVCVNSHRHPMQAKFQVSSVLAGSSCWLLLSGCVTSSPHQIDGGLTLGQAPTQRGMSNGTERQCGERDIVLKLVFFRNLALTWFRDGSSTA